MDAQFVLEYVKKTQLKTKKFNVLLDVNLNPQNIDFINTVKDEWRSRIGGEYDPSRVMVSFGAITSTGDSQMFNYKFVGKDKTELDSIQEEKNFVEIPFSTLMFFNLICGLLEGEEPVISVEDDILRMNYDATIIGIGGRLPPNQDIFQKILEWFNRVDAYGKLVSSQLEYPLLTKNSIFHDDFDAIFWTNSRMKYVAQGTKTIIMDKELVDLLLAVDICEYLGCPIFSLYACHYLFRKFYLMTPQEKREVSSLNNMFVPFWKSKDDQIIDWMSTLLDTFNENEFSILFVPFLNNIFPDILSGNQCCDTLPEKTIDEFVENKFLFAMS